MYVLYEDNGRFKAEKIFSKSDSTTQVEAASGKRSKIRNQKIFLEFNDTNPNELLEKAQQLSEAIDIDFLWQCAPDHDINPKTFAADYFGHEPNSIEITAMILVMHNAPVYFHKRARGTYKAAPAEILEAALAAIERKKQQDTQQDAWVEEIINGVWPEDFKDLAIHFLIKPDKNTLQYKAFENALKQLNTNAEQLLLDLGEFPSALALHHQRFLSNHFANGIHASDISYNPTEIELETADVIAYTVDDDDTTEFDDAISVTVLDNSILQLGIHIATPALAIYQNEKINEVAKQRMSSVYATGLKIPMLPKNVMQDFSLVAGTPKPALSLYVKINLDDGEIISSDTVLEKINVAANLSTNSKLESVTVEDIENHSQELEHAQWLRPLWQACKHLIHKRELSRGSPEKPNKIEYDLKIDGKYDDENARISIIQRKRDAPIQIIIAECMILANNLWGDRLQQHKLPGIYRSQQAGRTRMTTYPLPHESIGVPQYSWSTSPLRRYVDLVNQSQIIATTDAAKAAGITALYKPKNNDLFAIIGAFDNQYDAYNQYQNNIKRYWCLRWLKQENITTINANILRGDLVLLEGLPLVIKVPALPELNPDDLISIDIIETDEINLTVECRLRDTQ